MGHIFISYSRRDIEMVDQIASAMGKAGLEFWIDREDIKAGNSWRVQIVEAIDTCDAFVLMLSSSSTASDNVRKEIDLAQDSGRKIFAVMLEPVKLPAEIRYQLAGLQFIDVLMLGFDEAVRQLLDTVREHISTLKAASEQESRRVELVIKGVDLKAFNDDMQEQLLDYIAQLSNANRANLEIASLAAGSVHVFMDMPYRSAYELKTLALNRDNRFKKVKIISLRLAGNKKFVNTSLGILTTTAGIGLLHTLWLGTPALFVSVVGITVGKSLTFLVAAAVITGLAVSTSNVIVPLLFAPSPTLEATVPVETAVPTQTSTETPAPTDTVPPNTPTLTVTPSQTPTPQNPLVLEDAVCWSGPGTLYEVVGTLKKDTRLMILGRSSDGEFLIVEHPEFNSPCWVSVKDLQIEQGMDILEFEVDTPPPPPPPTPKPTKISLTP